MTRALVAAMICVIAGGALVLLLTLGGGGESKPRLACSEAVASVSTMPLGGSSIAVKASGTNGGGCLGR